MENLGIGELQLPAFKKHNGDVDTTVSCGSNARMHPVERPGPLRTQGWSWEYLVHP
jgi:hypothetical protein